MNGYTEMRAFSTEGPRCGLVSCELCGAVLLIDPDVPVNQLVLHSKWHETLELQQDDGAQK